MRQIAGIIIIFVVSSCSLSKKLPAGARIYDGADVKVSSESRKGNIREAAEVLSSNTFPVKNSMLLGFPYKVWFHYVIGEAKTDKGLRSFFQRKLGEKPVFFVQGNLETNERNLENIAQNMGFFQTQVTSESITKKYKAKAVYDVKLSPQYSLREITFDSLHFSIYSNPELLKARSLLKKGNAYDLQTIVNERSRISELFQNDGYYLLDPNRIIVRVDTNLNTTEANLHVQLKDEFKQQYARRFHIRDVTIHTTYASETGIQPDTLKQDLNDLTNTGLNVYDSRSYFKPKVFEEAVAFRKGDLYSKQRQEATYNRLSNLRTFKFIRNKFAVDSDTLANWLDVSYYLTPVERKTIQFNVNGQTKNNGLLGAEVGLSWLNRNLFHGAENFTMKFDIGRDLQFVNGSSANKFTRYSITSELVFPRFVLFFRRLNAGLSGGIPKSSVFLTYEELNQDQLYTQTSLNTGLNYYWRKNMEFDHTFSPLYVNLVTPRNVTERFIETVLESTNPNDLKRYFEILDSRLILGFEYKLNYIPSFAQNRYNTLSMNFGLDVAGNLPSLLVSKEPNSENGTRNFFGVPFDQFVKLNYEARYYRKSGSLTWANRLFAGFGLPYGNSTVIPQFKQYFIGGSNSLRGFRARSLGPGTVAPQDVEGSVFGNAISGDIRLELNTEFRYKVTDLLELATFYDTGNLWMYNENSVFGEEGKFSGKFLKELAADAGLGLRLDFTYVILRGDLALPLRKPWRVEKPWVFDEIRLGNKQWRRENLIFSLAIAHPF
jgi:outer membrane protein assembly factor BamA